MRFVLPMSYASAVDTLKEGIKKENLSDSVSVTAEPKELTVKVSKLGTSTFVFSVEETADSTIFAQTKESIAFTHRSYKPKIVQSVKNMVLERGGQFAA